MKKKKRRRKRVLTLTKPGVDEEEGERIFDVDEIGVGEGGGEEAR